MHAVTIREPGPPDVLEWTEVPDPEPRPGEVVVEIAATAVNRADLMQRQGHYPPPPGAPAWPGLECSGRVAALGADVDGWSVGDEVCALLSGGGYAERVAVPAAQVLPIPAGVDSVTAAGLPEVTCTVWSNLVDLGGLQAGQAVLVHGGASGIGTTAIQVAKAYGATVLVTAGSPSKLDRCRELGADVVISYREEDFVERTRAATGGRGADLVLDNMGAAYLARNLAALAPDGRLLVIGLQGGRTAEVDLGALLSRRGSIVATSLRSRLPEQKARVVAGVRRDLWPLVESGALRPVVDRVLPLRDAAEAHRVVEASAHVGKVLLSR